MNQPQQVIGRCRDCRKRVPTGDPTWAECKDRGRVNRTFAAEYHDCFVPRAEPRQCTMDDDGDFTGQAWSP